MSAYDMMEEKVQKKELKAPVYPTLEQDNIVERTEAQIADSEKRAQEMERQAKRARDMAIWGDIANLVAKGAAMHGGARKFNKDEGAAGKAQERLRAVQKENLAQMATYAKMRMAAADAQRKERNAAKIAQFNAEMDAYKREQAQANTLARLEEQERHNRAMEQIQTDREDRLEKQGGGSGVNRDVYLINDDGTKKVFKHSENANNIRDAYVWLYTNYPEYSVMRNELVYEEDRRGAKVPKVDAKGNKVYELVIDKYPTEQKIKQKFAEFNARELKKGNRWDGWKDGNATEDIDEDFE